MACQFGVAQRNLLGGPHRLPNLPSPPKSVRPLLDAFQAKRYCYVDLIEGFEEYSKGMTTAEIAPDSMPKPPVR